jgi:carboxymethylenebutenolidase
MTEIISRMVNYPSNTGTTPGYLSHPKETGKYPGVIVIQEWWGLVPHIKDLVDRFAGEGFYALAPDLYHGQATSEPDEARKLAMELDREQAVAEIVAALRHLQALDQVSPKQIGVVGFCMGGMLAVATASASREVGAAVAFYGGARNLELVSTIQCPLLGLFGEEDQGFPPETVRAFEQELEKFGVPHEIHIYPGAGHAFFNDARPHIYHPEAAKDAWERTLRWLRAYLK